MNIEILGCSGGIGHGLKTTTFLLDQQLLIDAGTGVELLTPEQMLAIRDVVITHAHLDHIAGLPLMLATIYDRHQHPVDVYGHPDVIEALKNHIFNWTIWPDYTCLPEQRPILRLHSIREGEKLSLQGKTLQALPAAHPTPTLGYYVSDGRHGFAFSGDSGCNDALWPLLNRIKPDLLIVDVSFTDEVDELARLSGHLTPSQLRQQLTRFQHRDTRILITHLKPGFEDAIIEHCQRLLPEWRVERLEQGARIRLGL